MVILWGHPCSLDSFLISGKKIHCELIDILSELDTLGIS